MSEFYKDMDILVAPSLWPESFGLVTREAILMGRWVVASDAGALAEDLQPGVNSHVFSVGDHTALKAILTELNENYGQYRQRIPLSGQAKGKISSVLEQVRELVKLYDSLLPNHLRKKNNTDQTLARQVV